MTSLRTEYMGIELESPIVVGACSLSKRVESIQELEAAGAGAVVIKSLFEEAIQLERGALEEDLSKYETMYSEALSMFPTIEHSGPKEHLYWIKETKKATKIPLIASLNAVNEDVWVDYAKQLADTGVDGLELNFYSPSIDPEVSADQIEKQELEIFAKVRKAVDIPIAVKLHANYTNMMRVATAFDNAGANALVLFNRLFQPDINVDEQAEAKILHLSNQSDSLVPLRWAALLHGRVKADIVCSSGIMEGKYVIKMILVGAAAVQVVSTLYKNKIPHIVKMLEDIKTWMQAKDAIEFGDFRGKMGKKEFKDAWAYERGQYIKALLGFD